MFQQAQPHQWLVRFQNKTHVICAQDDSELLHTLGVHTDWPLQHLVITHSSFPFVTITTRSSILGGKGGFGTLLKGQSKQAGAKLTTDFGACRDLQGRRLRHVNDEIKLRKWHEIQERKRAGEKVDEDAEYMNTPSGLYNWHLMIPTWADVGQKATKKLQYQVKHRTAMLERATTRKRSEKEEREREHAAAVQDYVAQTTHATDSLNVNAAIHQGLEKLKRKRTCITDDKDVSQHESILTLSGDFVVEQNMTLQSKSDFSTMVLVLERMPKAPVYYEVQLETAGISQVGWADLMNFRPNTDTGDGVGDDTGSFAFDGSRTRKFHDGTDETYGQEWKAGDVIGCLYDASSGEISYSRNGNSMGVAFVTDKGRPLVPSVSCNQGEILKLYSQFDQMKHMPKDCMPVHELMTQAEGEMKPAAEIREENEGSRQLYVIPVNGPKPPKSNFKSAAVLPEELNLDKYETIEQLEALGIDRLKSALMAMDCKCGGSAHERAERLFSLKGLERKDFPTKVRTKSFKE